MYLIISPSKLQNTEEVFNESVLSGLLKFTITGKQVALGSHTTDQIAQVIYATVVHLSSYKITEEVIEIALS